MSESQSNHELWNNYSFNRKPFNVLKCISNRELGMSKETFELQVTKIRVQQLKRCKGEFEIDPEIFYCKFLRNGDSGSIVGVWQRDMDPASKHSSIYHLKFEYNPHRHHDEFETCPLITNLICYGPHFRRMDVTDACQKYIRGQTLLLYVGNTAASGGRIFLTVTESESEPASIADGMWCPSTRILSCAGNVYTERFAAGTEKSCILLDTHHYEEIHGFLGDVLSVEFSKDGNLLYCGVDQNEFMFCDLREDVYQVNNNHLYKLGLHNVKEMTLLTDERTVIASETDGKLWKVDLRMRKPFFLFPTRVHTVGRRPLNVDEDLGLMCATGDDNFTKIWSLKSGEVFKSVDPRFEKIPAHACLVSNRRRWFLAVVEAGVVTPFFHH